MAEKNNPIKSIDNVVVKINEILLILMASVMFLFVFANVIGRYCFHYTFIWVDEFSRYLMISSAFLGMGLAMRKNHHSSFTVVQNLLPAIGRKILRALSALVIYGTMVLLFVLGIKYVKATSGNLTEALRWPVNYWYCAIPTGAFLFIWHFSMMLKEYINANPDAELERDIAENEAVIGDSAFLQDIESSEVEGSVTE